MSENKKDFSPTPSQTAAINVKANRILVSAAAGSGKSTVLTKRIISAICDENKKYDLSKLLIVTFTRDSAQDLKNKITEELNAKVKKDPSNKYLYDQLMKLPSAMLGTIDSVCFSYIKKYFDRLGLPASVSIIDENIADSLRGETMEQFIDYCYSGKFEAIPDFDSFVENFIGERDEKLSTVFLDLYSKIETLPNGFDTFDSGIFAKNGADFLKSPFGEILISRYLLVTDYFISILNEAVEYAKQDNPYSKYLPDFSDALNFAHNLDVALKEKNYSALSYYTSNLPDMPSGYVRKDKSLNGDLYLFDVKALYKTAAEWYNQVFCYTDAMFEMYSTKTADISFKIFEFLKEFHNRFSAVKLNRGNIDFDDLKHYAIKLFFNADGSVSDIAKEISSSLTEIYVDECQDLNPVQNKIFSALSVNCPIFMVGDIKQSIYGFRGADCGVFSHYKKTFPVYEGEKQYNDVTVFLSENFRSADIILDFANAVSDAMFYTPDYSNKCFEKRIPYTENDRLVFGKTKNEPYPEISIINCVPDRKNAYTNENLTTDLEATMVATEISRLIKSGVEPSDIAILLRNTKSKAKIFERKLTEKSIPVYSKKGVPLFDTPEVQLALCLLNCCDNPYRDIFLAGALRSPIFGVSLDELIKIKQSNKKASSLYEALIEYTSKTSFEKGIHFLDFLTKMRTFAMNTTVDKLLWQIYTETSFFSLIYDGTVSENEVIARRSNLLALHEMAKQLSAAGQGELYSFIEKVRIMIEEEKSPTAATTETSGVKIMTVHASKGLEFKYCFICSLSTTFNNQDSRSDIAFNKELGFAASIKDTLLISKFGTPFKTAMKVNQHYEWLEEEMRLLYVALTRAKYKLYLTSSVSDIGRVLKEAEMLAYHTHPYNFIRSSSLLKWILSALKAYSEKTPIYKIAERSQSEILSEYENESPIKSTSKPTAETIDEKELDKLYQLLKARMIYEYPHKASLPLPSKLSVSKLYPEILDEDGYYGAKDILCENGELNDILSLSEKIVLKDNSSLLKTPDFMASKSTVSAAEKGTATHIFMQFCDFDLLQKNGTEAEIARLTEKRFMLPEHADIIDRNVINSFLKSDIFSEMKNAVEINREYRFNIKLPASDFTANKNLKLTLTDEMIFVQGIIDCYFKDADGNIILLDYKTDFVPNEIRGNTEKEDQFFIDRHKLQLSYYEKALEILTKQPVKQTMVFSFTLGRCIKIK